MLPGAAARTLEEWDSSECKSGAWGFKKIGNVMGLISVIRTLDGERSLAAQYYGQCIYAGPNGWYATRGAGSAEGARDGPYIGDSIDTGRDFVFIHELGHGLNLPHGAGAYDKGEYPYEAGGSSGSTWAYDVNRNEMIDVFAHGSLGPNSVLDHRELRAALAHVTEIDVSTAAALALLEKYDVGEQPDGKLDLDEFSQLVDAEEISADAEETFARFDTRCDRDSPGAEGDLPDEYDDDEPVTHPTDDLGRCYKQSRCRAGTAKRRGCTISSSPTSPPAASRSGSRGTRAPARGRPSSTTAARTSTGRRRRRRPTRTGGGTRRRWRVPEPDKNGGVKRAKASVQMPVVKIILTASPSCSAAARAAARRRSSTPSRSTRSSSEGSSYHQHLPGVAGGRRRRDRRHRSRRRVAARRHLCRARL